MTLKRPNRDTWALGLAKLTATRSTCLRRQVGCVLLNSRGHVLATGYNGVASGQPHCNEQTGVELTVVPNYDMATGQMREMKVKPRIPIYRNACSGAHAPSGTALESCGAVHAEQNCLLQCRDMYEIESCYVTVSPCVHCVKMLLNTSCQRIIFLEPYAHDEAAKNLWLSAKRSDWVHYTETGWFDEFARSL